MKKIKEAFRACKEDVEELMNIVGGPDEALLALKEGTPFLALLVAITFTAFIFC